MADTKISGLPASTVPLGGTEVLPIVQGTTTKQVSIANVTAGRAVASLNLSTSGSTSTTPVLSFNASNCNLASGGTISGSYLQAVMQNKSGTAGASTNWALSNDLGTDSTYYGEFGMNSSVFSASTPADYFSINNGIYFSGHDGDVTVGSGNGYKTYLAWGSTGQSAHVINATGALGFSTNLGTTPALSGTTGFGSSGQALVSAGSAAAPAWSGSLTGLTTITTTNDTTISTLTVGKGGGAVATNTAVGYQTINVNSTGSQNSAVGYQALSNNVTGSNNTAIGSSALKANTTAVATLGAITGGTGYNGGASGGPFTVQASLSSGTAVVTGGTYPTLSITVTTGVITAATLVTNGTGFVDTTTVLTVTSAAMVTAGFAAGGSGFSIPVSTLATGGNNTAVGYQALNANTTGTQNVAVGLSALLVNTTGLRNVAIGQSALAGNTTTNFSTAVGYQALTASTAVGNTAIGNGAGQAVTTGTTNTLLGYLAGFSGTNNLTTGSNNTIIGNSAASSSATVSNEITLGNASVTSFRIPGLTITAGAKWINVGTSTVAALAAAATAGNGARAFVTDALAPAFGSTVAGGGAVSIPVYSDGTNWKVG